jgi:NRAMP (natural resistance-associated macrophage protein)-like metal ion transporter
MNKKFLKHLGPGIITGGADNDPAGIVTYTMAGAKTGFASLWVLLLCTPMLIVVQDMAARLAIVKRQGLSGIIKGEYGRNIALFIMTVLIIANTATIGADIAGVASVIGLVIGMDWLIFIIPVTALIGYLVVFKTYKTIRKVLIGLTVLLVVYVFSALLSNPNWITVAKGFIPAMNSSTMFVAVVIGIIGTTISPYLLFWQASDELEEHRRKPKKVDWDTIIGMVWSNIIAAFIIIAAATTLFAHTMEVETVEQAAMALRPLAGEWAYILFALGVVFSGFLALPVLAGSTSYAVSETFGWREGLNKKLMSAKGFYVVFSLSLIVGALISFLPINPIMFLFYTQVLDGFLLPFLVVLLLLLCNNRKVVGEYTNTKMKNTIGVLLLLILVSFDIIFVMDLVGI